MRDQAGVDSETYIFYIFAVNKVLMHFKILVVFAFILDVYLHTYIHTYIIHTYTHT